MVDREVWQLNFKLLPRNPHGKAGNEERRRSELDRDTRTKRDTKQQNILTLLILKFRRV